MAVFTKSPRQHCRYPKNLDLLSLAYLAPEVKRARGHLFAWQGGARGVYCPGSRIGSVHLIKDYTQ